MRREGKVNAPLLEVKMTWIRFEYLLRISKEVFYELWPGGRYCHFTDYRFTAKYNIMNMAFEKRTLLYKRILFISGMTELRQLPHPWPKIWKNRVRVCMLTKNVLFYPVGSVIYYLPHSGATKKAIIILL